MPTLSKSLPISPHRAIHIYNVSMTRTWCFVSLFLVSLVVVAAANGLLIRTECAGGHDDWASLRAEVGLLNDGRRIRPNNTADRHEESGRQRCVNHDNSPDSSKTAAYPNVAPEPSMYWPSVRMMPFGPAPYLKMLTVPRLN